MASPNPNRLLNLLGILNQTIEGTNERMEALQLQEMETDSNEAEILPFAGDLKQLQAYLTILTKAGHHLPSKE